VPEGLGCRLGGTTFDIQLDAQAIGTNRTAVAELSKRIVISVLGTHGDVQPFVALATRLKKRGFSPLICSNDDYKEFVEEHGIEFRGVGTDMRALLKQSKLDDATTLKFLIYAPQLLSEGQRMLREAGKRTWEAAQSADMLIFVSTTTFCIDIAEALGIPAIMTALQPLSPTGEFPYFQYEIEPVEPMLFKYKRTPFARVPGVDRYINKLSYMVQRAHQIFYDLPRQRLRRKLMGLRALSPGGFVKNSRGEAVTQLHAYSAAISPAPGDWPDNNIVTGYWRLEDNTNWQPPPDLEEFLSKGETPIYLGFGSMPFGAQRNGDLIRKAVSFWGGRAIIAKGWGGVKTEALPESVFVIDRAPHTKLFEHVKAVVHHGGAGTTQAGLEAGKPSFAVPQFFDQPYWGKLVYDLGCGPQPIRLKKLTPQVLANTLDDLATTPSYARAAEAIGTKMRLEDGTGRAVDVIEETLAERQPAIEGSYRAIEAAS
jgi:sterol 3beta-glucosyltransferase